MLKVEMRLEEFKHIERQVGGAWGWHYNLVGRDMLVWQPAGLVTFKGGQSERSFLTCYNYKTGRSMHRARAKAIADIMAAVSELNARKTVAAYVLVLEVVRGPHYMFGVGAFCMDWTQVEKLGMQNLWR